MNNWLRIGGARRLRNVMLGAATRTDFQGRGLFSRSVAHRSRLLGSSLDLSLQEMGVDRTRAPTWRRSIASLWCWLTSHHPYRRALRRQGFFDSRSATVLQYNPIGATPADLAPLRDPQARVHFLIGDTDLV